MFSTTSLPFSLIERFPCLVIPSKDSVGVDNDVKARLDISSDAALGTDAKVE